MSTVVPAGVTCPPVFLVTDPPAAGSGVFKPLITVPIVISPSGPTQGHRTPVTILSTCPFTIYTLISFPFIFLSLIAFPASLTRNRPLE